MPGATTHSIIGLLSAAAINYIQPYVPQDMLALAFVPGCAIVGALLPDIDHNVSRIRHATGTARGQGPLAIPGWLGGILSAILGGHRGFTHTALALGLLTWLLWRWWPGPFVLAFLIGYASHLIADAFTDVGVPLLWPLVWRKLRVWR
jgi:inner membrane protein